MVRKLSHLYNVCNGSMRLGDFHYMCTQSRRLRGASAEASYEVGRDAAPAGVAYATTSPGGRRAAPHGGTMAPCGSGRRTTRKRKRCRGGAPRGAGARVMSARARRSGLARTQIGPPWSNPGHAPLRRPIPLIRGKQTEGNTGEPPRPPKKQGPANYCLRVSSDERCLCATHFPFVPSASGDPGPITQCLGGFSGSPLALGRTARDQ